MGEGEGEKEEEKKKKEKGRREEKNLGLEHLLCLEQLFGYLYGNYLCKETIVRMLVWKFGDFYGTLV